MAEKGWRPEGWTNPYMGKVGGDLGNVFEAGADAMLKALIHKGSWMTPEQMKLLAPECKEVSMFQKGDKVRLSEYGLNFMYPSLAAKKYRDKAANKVFVVVGHSRDKECTRVITEGGNPNSSLTYHNSFLEKLS